MKRVIILSVLILFVSISRPSDLFSKQLPLKIEQTLDSESLPIFKPINPVWGTNGVLYVLNQGDATVMGLDDEYKPSKIFGGFGEGPGELSNPNNLLIIDDDLVVIKVLNASRFDLEGNYKETFKLNYQLSNSVFMDDRILGISQNSERLGVSLDREGNFLNLFGPVCDKEDIFSELAKCSQWIILQAKGSSYTMMDKFEGVVYYFDNEIELSGKIDLKLEGGGEITPTGWNNTVSDAIVNPNGGYVLLYYPKKGGRPHLLGYNELWEKIAEYEIPENIKMSEINFSPDGKLYLVNCRESQIHIASLD